MLATHDVDKKLLRNKVFHMSKNHFCLSPYEKDMKNDILKDPQITEKELEEMMIDVLPLMGYTIIPNNKKKLSQYKFPSKGVIDILTTHMRNLIGFELKKGRETGTHLTQILSYLNDLNEMNQSGNNKIIVVAFDYSDRFVKIIEEYEDIELWTYRMEFEPADYVTLVKGHEPMYNWVPIYTKEEARSLGYQSFDLQSWRKGKRAWELAGIPEPAGEHIPFLTSNVPFREDLDFKEDIENNPPVSIFSRIKNYVRTRRLEK